jgi:alcohol dehydrogenase, propanol-preferring
MRLLRLGEPLHLETRILPTPAPRQVLLKVRACGVCRTDLHVVDGELPDLRLPIVPGHEIVGDVIAKGENVHWPIGARLGVPWLGHTCGTCDFCLSGRENLCENARCTVINSMVVTPSDDIYGHENISDRLLERATTAR